MDDRLFERVQPVSLSLSRDACVSTTISLDPYDRREIKGAVYSILHKTDGREGMVFLPSRRRGYNVSPSVRVTI